MTAKSGSSTSLIVTVLNESETIEAFLRSLEMQTVHPAEVILVDGGSTDDTFERVQRYAAASRLDIVALRCPGIGISEGRNIAIERAATQWVLVADAGTILDRRWLEFMASAICDDIDVIGGFFRPLPGSFFESALGAIITPTVDEISARTFLPSSRSFGFRKSVWRASGGYPEWLDYCEDLVFDQELRRIGARFAFVPEAIAAWIARPTMWAFMMQYYRYARGDGKAGLFTRRHLARYGAYASAAALLVGGLYVTPVCLGLIVLGAALYLQRFVRRVLKRRQELSWRVPATLAVLTPLVVAGDLAKMAGYPVGRWRRHKWGVGEAV